MLRADDRLMHAASGCVLDVAVIDGRRCLACFHAADEETPLATASTAAWRLMPNDGIALKIPGDDDENESNESPPRTQLLITRKTVLDRSRGATLAAAEEKGKKEIYVLETKCDESKSIREKYSQLFKYVIEADSVEVLLHICF